MQRGSGCRAPVLLMLALSLGLFPLPGVPGSGVGAGRARVDPATGGPGCNASLCPLWEQQLLTMEAAATTAAFDPGSSASPLLSKKSGRGREPPPSLSPGRALWRTQAMKVAPRPASDQKGGWCSAAPCCSQHRLLLGCPHALAGVTWKCSGPCCGCCPHLLHWAQTCSLGAGGRQRVGTKSFLMPSAQRLSNATCTSSPRA